ncbi:MAG TPA: ABC transporter C-terminal domain-containing protein, partial [Chthoniobacterales bacterium]|nr:ABC transporter C-terminal domain-containing protein [Chthoniobacterales bacterium]
KSVLHISAGQLTPYAGDYDYYLDKSRATSARAALTAVARVANPGSSLTNHSPDGRPSSAGDSVPSYSGRAEARPSGLRETREQRRAEAEQRKAEAKVKRDHEKRVRELEMHILSLEGRQRELTAKLEKPETYDAGGAAMELNRELSSVTAELERTTREWETLAEQMPA